MVCADYLKNHLTRNGFKEYNRAPLCFVLVLVLGALFRTPLFGTGSRGRSRLRGFVWYCFVSYWVARAPPSAGVCAGPWRGCGSPCAPCQIKKFVAYWCVLYLTLFRTRCGARSAPRGVKGVIDLFALVGPVE